MAGVLRPARRLVREPWQVFVPLLRGQDAARGGADAPDGVAGVDVPQPYGVGAAGDPEHVTGGAEGEEVAGLGVGAHRLADRAGVGGVGDVPEADRGVVAAAGQGAAV